MTSSLLQSNFMSDFRDTCKPTWLMRLAMLVIFMKVTSARSIGEYSCLRTDNTGFDTACTNSAKNPSEIKIGA